MIDQYGEPDDSAGSVNAKDVPGPVEVYFTGLQNADLVPEMTSCRPKKSTKRQKLYRQVARFEKCPHNYTKIAQKIMFERKKVATSCGLCVVLMGTVINLTCTVGRIQVEVISVTGMTYP